MRRLCSRTFVMALLMSIITVIHNSEERVSRLVKSTETLIEGNLAKNTRANPDKKTKTVKLKNFANNLRPPFKGLTKRTKSSYRSKPKNLTDFVKDMDNTVNNKYDYNTKHKENNNADLQDSEGYIKKLMYISNRSAVSEDQNTMRNAKDDYIDKMGLEADELISTEETVSEHGDNVTEDNIDETDNIKIYRNLLQLDLKPGLSPRRNVNSIKKNDAPAKVNITKKKSTRNENDKISAEVYAEIARHGADEPSHSNLDTSVADQLAENVRVLCLVMTEAQRHGTNAAHVRATWGKRCNKLVFMSSAKDPNLPAVNLHIHDGREHLWEKTIEAFSYVHKELRDEADWFLKADDDTYVILENLRYMLAEYDSDQPLFFGCRFKPYTKQGYMSGGAGYVLSRAALDRLNRAFQIRNMCNVRSTSAEDVELGKCLERIGVRAMDTRDPFGRGRFFPFPPRENFFPDKKKMAWYYDYLYYPVKEGQECCSNTAISFHGLEGRDMYILEYLIYHLRPHGNPLLVPEARGLADMEIAEGISGQYARDKLPVAEIHYNVFD